ncbi:MAG: hypothetical protein QXG03_12415 [Halalkalicoccus sp.]
MAPKLPELLGRGFEQGMEAAFAVDSLAQLAEAVDFEALERGDPAAMDFEQMGELVGQMTGRLVIKQTVGRYTPGQFAEQTVGYAIGGAIGREGGRLVLQAVESQRERGDPVQVEIEVVDEEQVEEREDIHDLGEAGDLDDSGDEFDDADGADGAEDGSTADGE